ncbi:MAG: hypothetical protein ABIO80_01530, partial [Sphingomicrobium sp.]
MFGLLLFVAGLWACTRDGRTADLSPSACHPQSFDGSRFTVCDPGAGQLRLFAAGKAQAPQRRFADL